MECSTEVRNGYPNQRQGGNCIIRSDLEDGRARRPSQKNDLRPLYRPASPLPTCVPLPTAEYFHLTLQEIRDAVAELHGLVTFRLEPDAEKYRTSVAMRKEVTADVA